MAQKIDKLVPDTSVLIEGLVSEKIKRKELEVNAIIFHEAVLSELEHQANLNKAIGFLGLEEIRRVRELAEGNFEVKFSGVRPKPIELRDASLGEIDSLIRQLAWEEDATLFTSDKVQSKVAVARGIKVLYIEPKEGQRKLKLEKFFDETTMSAHLREGVPPIAKKGAPGKWDFVQLRKGELKQEEIQEISQEIIEEAKFRRDAFIEIERPGSTIVQLGHFRIVITKPPFSDGWEITAVRPVKQLTIDDYKLSEKLFKRIGEQAEGVLVAGAPGMGKSTFAQALCIFYAGNQKIVKTVEAPRDLILPDTITQYAISHGDAQEIHDILLLSRPDYTIFDEMRNTDDFKLFADLRLAGVGMVGVVHATNPIDAIQRFIGRIEMGVIPQVIDTVVFIKNGFIQKVLGLEMTVKVPVGMTEADLARPVVVVNDFETGKMEYEIYSYGEQTVVIPIREEKATGAKRLAEEQIKREMRKYTDTVEVKVLSDNKCIVYVKPQDIGAIIGKQGKNIERIEHDLGIHIDVQELEEIAPKEKGVSESYQLRIKKNYVLFEMDIKQQSKDVDIYLNGHFLFTAKAGQTGVIKIKKASPYGKRIVEAINSKEELNLYVRH
ncbi:MAG TPA: PINc/VapC family ATPase [Candidatus Nanoarchaeia archaeon]|nr:PINc/VapC family ATPase [Candidatus Nanoarchaeia archaeon]